MKTNDVLRRIVSVLLILTLVTSLFVNLPLSLSAEDEGLQGGQSNIINGSFEYPALRADDIKDKNAGWANVLYDNTAYDPNQLGWKTTATNKKIEFAWLKDTDVPANMSPHMKPITVQTVTGVAASDGYQFAEVVANKVSSLFQILPVESGENYKWTIHHRGRTEDNDTLAFIITDKDNSVDYGAETQDKSDCFQQIITWMKSQGVTAPTAGVMKEHTVYTTKLNDLYSFNNSSFSFTSDSEHTERFSIFLMSTNKLDWGEYSGYYSLDETEQNKEILFVLTPFSTSFKSSSGTISTSGGNLIDNISFTNKKGENRLVNAGFDDISISGTYSSLQSANAPSPKKGIGWSTTASDYNVEVGNIKNGDAYGLGAKITTETIKPSIRDGEQFAELNADEESSLYQIVNTDPGKMYKWSLSHRGRDGIDTMALIIGPAQFDELGNSILPKKTSAAARDQLMQISDWLYSQTDMPLDLPKDGGCSDKIKVYTPKFNSNGGWTESENIFSFYKDETHTEEWSVWIISSSNDKWHDYGEIDETATYNYNYIVPKDQEKSIFGFVSNSSYKADGTKNSMSYGNLLDNIAFKEYYYAKVEIAMNDSRGSAYITYGEEDSFIFDDESFKLGWALQHSDFTVHVAEGEGENYRAFIGAYINGKFIPKTDEGWVYNETTKEYTYIIRNVTEAIKVNIIFSAKQIYYDSQVPDEDYKYQYDPVINENTGEVLGYTGGPEVPMSEDGLKEYISHAPKAPNDGWKFIDWKYINPAGNKVYKFDAVHKVKLIENSEGSALPTFSIYPSKTATEATVSNIPYNDGITFLAEWKYRQRAIAQTYDEDKSQYFESTVGGTVDVAISYGKSEEDDENATDYKDENDVQVGRELYAYADDTYVTVTATRKAGYTFNGWYDGEGKLISKNANYVYKVNSGATKTLYARFDPAGCNLRLDCSIYSSESGDTDKDFDIYCFLSGLRAGKRYTSSYVSDGSVKNYEFVADVNGKATVILEKMKHRDYAEFIYLPDGCKYTIEADPAAASDGFGIKGEVKDKLLTRPTGSQETIPLITEHIIFYKASQSVMLEAGKHYEGISEDNDPITVTEKSSFTFQAETRYNPSMYANVSASLCFYSTDDAAKEFFIGTRILMIDLSNSEIPKYYSYTVNASTSAIALTKFTELGSTGTFTMKKGDMLAEKLVFIVDYVGTNDAVSGKISLVYGDDNNELSGILTPVKKTVNIREDTTGITAAKVGNGKTSSSGPFAINLNIAESSPAVNTSYKEDDFTNSEYAVKLSLDGDKRLPDGSYAVVDGKTYYCNDGYINISPLKYGPFDVNVYSPVPVELVDNKVTFKAILLSAVTASPAVPAEKTAEPIEFNCADVAIDADVTDKVLNPGKVSAVDVTLKYRGVDNFKLNISKKNSDHTFNAILENVTVNLPNNENSFEVTLGNGFTAVSGETYIFTFVGYSGDVPVIEDKCCVAGGYVSR